VSTSRLGTDAPAYYEYGTPTGAYAGQIAKAIMIVIHGGAWYTVGKGIVAANRPEANRWRDAGWATVNIDYRACGQSVGDVFWFMNRLRQKYPAAIVCATGVSAGGHLALILASIRRDLACAISKAGPSDLLALDAQTAIDKATGLPSTAGPTQLQTYAIAALGAKPTPLVNSSPTKYAPAITARLLLATAANDVLVPAVQDTNFATAVLAGHPSNYADTLSLAAGSTLFVHGYVSPESLAALRAREDALVAPLFP
jgi:acetyl esterase/lipase